MYEDYVWDNYRYNKNGTYFICCKYKKGQCRGRGTLVDGIFNVTQQHNHGPNIPELQDRAFKRELFEMVTTTFLNLRQIYDEVRISHREASIRIPFVKIEANMNNWRRNCSPPLSNSLPSYVETINSNDWEHLKDYDAGTINVSLVTATDDSKAVLFCDTNFAPQIFLNSTIYIDATFKVVPKNVGGKQLLTLMGIKHDHAIPFAWAIMSKKSRAAYRAVFQKLKMLMPNFVIRESMTDYEEMLQEALRMEFAGIIITACLFHYDQCLYRKAKQLGLKNILIVSNEGYNILKHLMALALLPANEIREAYFEIRESIALTTRILIKRFLSYYERQWLGRVTPEVFSVFGLERRTNNNVEAYNKQLKETFEIHPNIWKFTFKLRNHQQGLRYDIASLRRGIEISRSPKAEDVLKHMQILEWWGKLQEEDRPTSIEFLEKMILISINPIYEFFNNSD